MIGISYTGYKTTVKVKSILIDWSGGSMAADKKKICIVFFILLLFTAGILTIFINTDVKSKLIIKGERKVVFYSLKTFGTTYLVRLEGYNIFKYKLLLCRDDIKTSGFRDGKNIYVLCSSGSDINIYSTEGNVISSYKADNRIISICSGDINLDGTDEILVITGEGSSDLKNEISILSFNDRITLIYRKSLKGLDPWKVQLGDVDGDGKKDISIGVYKTTLFHPVMAKRPFIYNWEEGFISPKWLGSRLSQPFDDYVFCDVDSDGLDEIAAIENTQDSKKVIGIYKWKGFGVELMNSGDKYNDMKDIMVANNNSLRRIEVKVKKNNKWVWCNVIYKNGKIFLNKGNGFMNLNVY